MSTPFAFLPRAISKQTREQVSRPPPASDSTTTTDDDDEHDGEHKQKAIEPAHSSISPDIAVLITLALSNYNIWHDSDLRWKLDACLQDDPNDAGFVPINYLLRRPPFRGALLLASSPDPSETDVVKALRAHASRALEVRMRLPLSSPSAASSIWYSTGKTARKKDVGGYEVRRRDWVTLRDRPSCVWSRARWDDLTAYMECIPPQYRSVGGIARFADALLSLDMDADAARHVRVERIALPPHYLDKPGDAPKCKGYALITFSSKPDLERMLRTWPWDRRPAPLPTSPIVKEAHKYGLRAISKARWDALNEEYLAYRQVLVNEMARTERDMQADAPSALPSEVQTETEDHTEMQTTPFSPYPFDCLVFVRNVHPDTNKTMLRSLFAQAFQDQDQLRDQGGRAPMTVGLDYVDFNKGTDTCYLRLASPSHATRLIAYFTAHPKMQAHGLDTTGQTPLADDKSFAFEQVQGKKEEVYWDKIPDKVRRQAVERVVQAQRARSEPESGGGKRKKRTRER